jgi:hypothetical protein
MYFCRIKKVGSLKFIGSKFDLDHCTVIHSVKTIQNYIETDKVKRKRIEEYANQLDCLKEIYSIKTQLEKALAPLQDEVSVIEQRLINIRLTFDNLMNQVNNQYH